MSWLHAETVLLDAGRTAIGFAVNWLLQSTLLLAAGLAIGRLVQHRGSAVQSAVYRTTLVAVLVCPLSTVLFALGGVSGWSLEMPAAWTEEPRNHLAAGVVPFAAGPIVTIATAENNLPFDGGSFPRADSTDGANMPGNADNWAATPHETAIAAGSSPLRAAGNPAINAGQAVAPSTISALPKTSSFAVHWFGLLAIGVSCLWIAATSVLLVRLALAWRRLTGLRRGAIQAEFSTLQTCLELASLVDVRAPDVLRSPFFPSPCLTGLRRPAVLLPDADANLPLRDVLIHELAHLRRRDCHWNLLWRLAACVFFFQPLLWLLTRRLEATAEEVCDDYVVQYGGVREEYAHRLVDIAELSCAPLAVAGVGIVSLRSMLAQRVVRIMDTSRSLSTRVGSVLLTIVVAGGLVGTALVGFVGVGAKPTLADVEAKLPDSTDAASDAQAGPAVEGIEPLAQQAASENIGELSPSTVAKSEWPPSAPREELHGRVLDAAGKPVAGAKLHWFRGRIHDIQPMKPLLVATTNDAGEFRFAPPQLSAIEQQEPASWIYDERIVVTAAGRGFVYTSPVELRRETPRGNVISGLVQQLVGDSPGTVRLPAAGDPIRGRLVNIDGQPVAGATVRTCWFNDRSQATSPLASAVDLAAWKARVMQLTRVIEPVQLRDLLPTATTDAAGCFELRDIGAHRLLQLLVQGEDIESTEIVARNESGEAIVIEADRQAREPARTVYPRDLFLAVGPSKTVLGRVYDFDTGKPIGGAVVRAFMIHGSNLNSSRDRQQFATIAGEDGRYRITGLPIGDNRLVAFGLGDDVPYFPAGRRINTATGDADFLRRDFRLKRGVWAEGRVFDGATDKPFTGSLDYYWFPDPALDQAFPDLRYVYVDGRYWTNSRGEFRMPVLPGRGILTFSYSGTARDREGIDRFARGYGADAIEGSNEVISGMPHFLTLPSYVYPPNFERVAEVHPTAGQTSVRVDMPLYASEPVAVRVVDAEGKPLSGTQVRGHSERAAWQNQESDRFEIVDLRPNERRKVFVFKPDQNLSGAAIVQQGAGAAVEIRLIEGGSVAGRLLDGDGEPITDAMISLNYEKLKTDDNAAMWAPQVGLATINPTTIPVDAEGRFVIRGLIPGWKHSARASQMRKVQNDFQSFGIGSPFVDVTVTPGEEKELGDLVLKPQTSAEATVAAPAASKTPQAARITGRVIGVDGQPAAGVHIAAIGRRTQPSRGGELPPDGEVLAAGTTDQGGQYQLVLNGVSAKTHAYANLIARADGAAIAWQTLNLDAPETEALLTLPAEEPIRGRLVDIEGQPAAGVQLTISSVMKRVEGRKPSDGVGYQGKVTPAAWFAPVTSDAQGRFTIGGVPAGHGVFLETSGTDRSAPQDISLNTGMSETRGERDRTYRSLVKNLKPGEEALLPLAPAQLFEGVVRYEDTGEPAAHARLTIWASQQESGSMVSVAGTADAQGRYRISPRPGIRFGVTAYPPDGEPYLPRKTPLDEAIRWEAGDRVKNVDLTLPRGVPVLGKVIEAGTGAPVANVSIQYIPEANNPHASDSILTGWQGTQLSDQDGRFQIVVLPWPGRLLAQATAGSYILQEIGSQQLYQDKPGGERNYAHAIRKLDPLLDAQSLAVTIELQPGATLAGRIVDESGKPVDEAEVITRLKVWELRWRPGMPPARGGRFELAGLKTGVEYPVYFLDAKRQLGAAANLKATDPTPTVVLRPCGVASMRFVDGQGQPVADYTPTVEIVVTPGELRFNRAAMQLGVLAADSDYIANVDRTNHWTPRKSDDAGKLSLPALIPGASYRVVTYRNGEFHLGKDFQVKAGETLDLGDIVVERPE